MDGRAMTTHQGAGFADEIEVDSPGTSRAVLSVSNLTVSLDERWNVVENVTFDVKRGKTLALIGESGSGKSVTALALINLLPSRRMKITDGAVDLDGDDLVTLAARAVRQRLGSRIGTVFQDPASALNPSYTVGEQIAEVLRHHKELPRGAARDEAVRLLREVGLPDPSRQASTYPHQMSGGMKQRATIAIAIACNPAVLIADEPTTALDVTIQAEILDLLQRLRERHELGLLLITHDAGVVARTADDVAVMYAGRIIESGPAVDVLLRPIHPYTRALLASTPTNAAGPRATLTVIRGMPPALTDRGAGCAFAPRCDLAQDICLSLTPAMVSVRPGHQAACHVTAPPQPVGDSAREPK
jgi:peptide/nickel transport system ATP-binding protein